MSLEKHFNQLEVETHWTDWLLLVMFFPFLIGVAITGILREVRK